MPIKIKHAPSAAAIGESAYTIGRGEKMRWATDVALKQQALSIQGKSVALTAQARAGQLALREKELGFRKEQWEDEPARQLERGLQEQKRLRGQEVWQYTESQKRRRAQVLEGLNWLQQRDDWTPEQKEDAARQLWGVFYRIIPGPVDVGPSIQQQHDSQYVTDQESGARYWMKPNGDREQVGMTEAEWGKDYDNSFKVLAAAMIGQVPTPEQVEAHMKTKRVGYAKHQALATQTKEERARLQQKAVQDLQAMDMKAQAERRGIIAALPNAFDRIIKGQPKSKGLKKGVLAEKTYSEEEYKNALAITTEQYSDIPPDIIKDEFDKWRAERQAAPETGYGQRADGTQKGTGFFGELKLPDGGVATEYSVGVQLESKGGKETEIPSLVPTLTKDELDLMVNDIIPNRKKVPDAILQKAVDHANKRVKQGKSPFAEPGEAAPASQEEFIRTIQGMTDKKKAKAYYDKWVSKWR